MKGEKARFPYTCIEILFMRKRRTLSNNNNSSCTNSMNELFNTNSFFSRFQLKKERSKKNCRKTRMIPIKLVTVADDGVGKTCMFVAYTTYTFPTEHIPTVFENYKKTVLVPGVPFS